MRPKSKIRWTRADKKAIATAVGSFNAKITRTLKKNPEMVLFLPERLTTAEVRANVTTRQDLNKQLNAIKRFLRQGAEAPVINEVGTRTTKWQLRELRIQQGVINRAKNREMKILQPSYEKGNFFTIEERNLQPTKFDFSKMSERNFKKYIEGLNKMSKTTYWEQGYEKYRRGYLGAMTNTMYAYSRFDELYSLVSSLDSYEVYKAGLVDPTLTLTEFYYSSLDVLEEYGEQILSAWERYLS